MPDSVSKTVLTLRIAGLAVLYVLTGKLGLMLAVPPGYATVIWPPSGIALGLVLLYGRGLWPGVFIGSALLNGWISHAWSPATGFDVGGLPTALGIAAGSTLQVLVTRALVIRLFGLPLRLGRPGDLGKVFAVTGPLGCLTAATVGVATLHFAGDLPADSIPGNWLAWWAGDTFGVLLFLPLVLTAPFGRSRRLLWRNQPLGMLPFVAMLTLIVPLALTIYAWRLTTESMTARGASEFRALSLEHENALRHRLDAHLHALQGGVAYYLGSDHVTREEWRTYVALIDPARNYPGMRELGFQEQVPETGEERVAAETARDTGSPTLTRRLLLPVGAESTPGMLLFQPIYDSARPASTVTERRAALRGWMYSSFVARDLLDSLTAGQGSMFEVAVYDGEDESPETLVYRSDARQPLTDATYTVAKPLTLMNRTWFVVWRSTPAFVATTHGSEPLWVLVGGLLFTGLFSLFVMIVIVRRIDTMEWMAGDRGYLVPVGVFVLAVAGSFWLFTTLQANERERLRGDLAERATRLQLVMNSETAIKTNALYRLARRWGTDTGNDEREWRRDAADYMQQLVGLKGISWVDADSRLRWIEPLPGNERLVGIDARGNEARAAALAAAANTDAVVTTAPLDLVTGEKGIVAFARVQRGGRPDGFMAGSFSLPELLSTLEPLNPGYELSFVVLDRGKEIYRSNDPRSSLRPALGIEAPLRILDQPLTVGIVPSAAFVARQGTVLPQTTLIAGLLIGALLALMTRVVMVAKLRSRHLLVSNRLNDAILSSAANPIVATDPEGVVTMFNQAAEAALGYSAADVVGRHTPALWHDPAEIARRAEQLSRELSRPIPAGYDVFTTKPKLLGKEVSEWTLIRRGGSRFTAMLTATPLRDASGAITGYLGLVEDVTERKRAQDALRASEETFRSAMEAASIGMALVKPDGHFMKVNPALCALLGYDEAELLAKNFQSITVPEDLAADLDRLRQVLDGETPSYRLEKRYYHRTGRIVSTVISVSLVRDENGRPEYFVAQIQDVSEQKEVERLKNEFISIVSHELRTPLTSIRGSLGLILGAMSAGLPKSVVQLIDIANQSCERLIVLINDILDIDKVASGQMRLSMRSLPLVEVTRKAMASLEAYARKFDVTLVLESFREDLTVDIDEERFIQVLSNLLSNAAKFSPAGGQVTVAIEAADRHVRLSVRDRGPGIPAEFRGRIFEKFSQADSSAARRAGGTGLGLHITRQLVERMHGRIGFDTQEGGGTTFWVELPLSSTAPDVASPEGHTARQPRTPVLPRILHVEDDPSLTNMLAAGLAGRAEVVSAETLHQAETLLSQQAFSLIVLDVHLPDGSGIDLLARLAALGHGHVPVVLLCAEAPHPTVYSLAAAVMVKTRVAESRVVQEILGVLERRTPPPLMDDAGSAGG